MAQAEVSLLLLVLCAFALVLHAAPSSRDILRNDEEKRGGIAPSMRGEGFYQSLFGKRGGVENKMTGNGFYQSLYGGKRGGIANNVAGSNFYRSIYPMSQRGLAPTALKRAPLNDQDTDRFDRDYLSTIIGMGNDKPKPLGHVSHRPWNNYGSAYGLHNNFGTPISYGGGYDDDDSPYGSNDGDYYDDYNYDDHHDDGRYDDDRYDDDRYDDDRSRDVKRDRAEANVKHMKQQSRDYLSWGWESDIWGDNSSPWGIYNYDYDDDDDISNDYYSWPKLKKMQKRSIGKDRFDRDYLSTIIGMGNDKPKPLGHVSHRPWNNYGSAYGLHNNFGTPISYGGGYDDDDSPYGSNDGDYYDDYNYDDHYDDNHYDDDHYDDDHYDDDHYDDDHYDDESKEDDISEVGSEGCITEEQSISEEHDSESRTSRDVKRDRVEANVKHMSELSEKILVDKKRAPTLENSAFFSAFKRYLNEARILADDKRK